MNPEEIHSIDDVIEALTGIVNLSIAEESTQGYFAALYLKVTKQVKKGILEDYFDDGPRMEKLDVVFAKRYIEAYYQHREGKSTTKSWEQAFEMTNEYRFIVLQHLLAGMNAHINLDLGIAAATVMEGKPIEDLHDDFNKINEILSSLVEEVEHDLSQIWPKLKKILKWFRRVDNFLIDFSMTLARDGAWRFAVRLSRQTSFANSIHERDRKVANMAEIVTNPGWIANFAFKWIRRRERGTIAEKIQALLD